MENKNKLRIEKLRNRLTAVQFNSNSTNQERWAAISALDYIGKPMCAPVATGVPVVKKRS